jgi:hypothetical protein
MIVTDDGKDNAPADKSAEGEGVVLPVTVVRRCESSLVREEHHMPLDARIPALLDAFIARHFELTPLNLLFASTISASHQ